jgi:hypothetical protein
VKPAAVPVLDVWAEDQGQGPLRLSVTPGPPDDGLGLQARSNVAGVSGAFPTERIRPERRDLAFRQPDPCATPSRQPAGQISTADTAAIGGSRRGTRASSMASYIGWHSWVARGLLEQTCARAFLKARPYT